MAQSSEVIKLQQHLSLLKQEYSKLQTKYHEIETKYNTIAATNDKNLENTFASRLLKTISNLYDSEVYSDIKIKLMDKDLNAHRLVLSARSNIWSESVLDDKYELDWSEIDPEVAEALALWLYTSNLNLSSSTLALKLIKTAHEFLLSSLVELCEQFLISVVNIRSCVKIYSVAEEIEAVTLREYCSGLISTHWDDLNTSDFDHMSGPLLYKMLKSKSKLLLHSAVRLQREDVVFLCLVENSASLSDIVNLWSSEGELPLDLALSSHNESIAATLVQHNADLNIRDSNGDPLLHRMIKKGDTFSAMFLLENHCDALLSTRNENDSALHLVAGASSIEHCDKIAEKLLNKNVNVNAQNRQGFTPLHIAIQADNRPIFDLLLKQDYLNVNTITNEEHSPLYYALLKYESGDDGDNCYAASLLKHGAKTNPVYSQNQNSLLQVLVLNGAEKAAVFFSEQLKSLDHVNSEGESVLHLACLMNYVGLVRCLLNFGSNANLITNTLGQSPSHYAVKSNSARCIEAIIEFNEQIEQNGGSNESRVPCNFNLRDANGDTPINLALNEGFNDLVPMLIKGKADVNIRNSKDFTLLHQAILKEDSKTAIFLLDNGVDINAKTSDYETPLQLAIHCRLADVVEVLCTRGVDMSAPDKEGNCALWAALYSDQENIASILVRHGADTDCWGPGPDGCRQTLLHRAIDENKEAAAIFLIQAGCDLNSSRLPGPTGEGGEAATDKRSPLHLCCQWGLEPVVRCTLVEHRANVNIRDADSKTPIHVAIENRQDDIISLLLSVPEMDLSIRDKSGLSPFATALTYRNNKAAEAILDKLPTAAEQFDSRGQNFLHIAIQKGDIESALFLLTVQVDVNSRIQGPMLTPPIHLAAQYGNETLVRSLILAGARVDDRDAQKRTALHVASESGNAPAVSALLQNNADCDAFDMAHDNALHIAVREGHLGVVRALLTESTIDAEAINLKGRNPLHELCKYGKENAATICELFLECMSNYPINNLDVNGNSPLLLAYMKGNGNLCRALVSANACLASENHEKVTIFNYQVPSKQLLNRLLDQLAQPATWTNTDSCQECGKNFSIAVRTHHCRHCGRALCSKCSDQEVPIIKFGENKPVRVCRICSDILKIGAS